jgi:hypothetical protein
MTDFTVSIVSGNLGLVYPQNAQAQEYLQEHVQEDAQWFGRGLVVEARYMADLVNGLRNDGFEVAT